MNERVRQAWEDFHGKGALPRAVRPAVLASWQRSQAHDVAAARSAPTVLAPGELHRRRAQNTALLKAARPAMEAGQCHLADTNSMILLTDPEGAVLETVGDRRTLDAGHDINLREGGQWNESDIGTNAIGTAIALGAPVRIHAAEHFCHTVHAWTCAAAPVRHPVDHSLLGIVDISAPAETFHPQSLAHAVAIARQIEMTLTHEIEMEHEQVLRHFLDRRASWAHCETLALGRRGKIIYATESALRDIARSRPALIADGALRLDGDADLADWTRQLGESLPGATLEFVERDGRKLGGILVLPTRRPRAPHRAVPDGFARILGDSPALREACERARRMAASGAPILLEGETGVGKEVFARAIHGESGQGPFVPVNCGGLPRELIASELFGYAPGAFTGADGAGRAGKIEAAANGVLCLDELGEMPMELQAYLLRVLEDGVVYRLGSHDARHVNLRLLSMTNRDLLADVAAGRFRRDLYYRIATLRLRIPPLRERGHDVALLAEHVARTVAQRLGRETPRLSSRLLDRLGDYTWPGNVRELRNVVESMVVMGNGPVLDVDALPRELLWQPAAGAPGAGPLEGVSDLKTAERLTIAQVIDDAGGNLTLAARRLGIARSTLYMRLVKYGRRDE